MVQRVENIELAEHLDAGKEETVDDACVEGADEAGSLGVAPLLDFVLALRMP
jgi:hypothetical protein